MMEDVSKEARAIAAGETIERFLNDEIVKMAFGALEKGYADAWKTSADAAQREMLFAKVSVLQDLQSAFRSVVDNGKVTKAKVEHREKLEALQNPAKRPR